MFAMQKPFGEATRYWRRPFSANMTKRRIHRGVGGPPDPAGRRRHGRPFIPAASSFRTPTHGYEAKRPPLCRHSLGAGTERVIDEPRVPPFADSSAHLTIASKRSRSSSSSSGRCRVMAGNIYRERRRAEGLARLRKLRMRRRGKNMTISLPVLSRSLRLWQSWFRPCCLEFAIRGVFRIAAGFLRPAVEPIPGDHVAFFTHLVHEVVTAVKLRRIS